MVINIVNTIPEVKSDKAIYNNTTNGKKSTLPRVTNFAKHDHHVNIGSSN